LCECKDDFSRDLLESFRDDEESTAPISEDEMDDFIEFTRTYGV
jgi:hypothetical protein